jgi:divinyl protochlorophyllide a 8-vinyl-reductase
VRTARYLLAHRIPTAAQAVLRALPARLAQRLLLSLVARHAWTFAGSADFRAEPGRPARVVFVGSPLARVEDATAPVCGFYVGTFETLFRTLVHPGTRASETTCAATGAPRCTLVLSW